ncbi:MAG TPA: hypothetical protein VFG89_06720 [Coriobacteriia bacterium]|nr:hypothetical protein [Coriobacteriia bacterium]
MGVIVTATEVARQFAEYLNRVAFRHESFVIVRGNKRVAELRPLPAGRALGDLPALFDALPRLGGADAVAFGVDLETSRDSLRQIEVRDAWES